MTKHHSAWGRETRSVTQLTTHILQQVLDASSDGLLLLSTASDELAIAYANRQFERLSGYARERLDGLSWRTLGGHSAEATELRDALAGGLGFSGTLRFEREDGSQWRASVRAHPVRDEGGATAFWLCQFLPPADEPGAEAGESWSALLEPDATRLRERFGRLDRADASSGLLLYERFRDFVERDLVIARRERRPVSLMFLRIAELDRYLATFGKNAADSCLRMIGKQVTATLRRATDLCARFADDAIIAAVFGQDAAEAGRLLERICENIDSLKIHNPHGRRHRFLSVRSAVVESTEGGESLETLLERLQNAVADGEESAAHA
jgi:diguanylate cyclase (GGDEF)-like protein/PAS domain S-box-containing protein